MSGQPQNPMPTLPDAQTYLLPSRAYLLSLRDQSLPLRRVALEDAEAYFQEVAGCDRYETQLAVVAVIGEALQIVEDVAALAGSFWESPEGTAFFATAASYSTRAVDRFYSGLRKRSLEEILHLLGMRYGGMRTEDGFFVDPPYTAEERAAIEEAHLATARLVHDHLLRLAADWRRYQRFFLAYKHGLLVVNANDAAVVDDRATPVEGIAVWRLRRPGPEAFGTIEPPYEDTVGYVGEVGRLALDILDELTQSRLSIFDLIEWNPDGTWRTRPLTRTPWRWWFRRGEVSQRSLDLLSARFGISFD